MIELTIKRAAMDRGVENPTQLARKMGCAPNIIWRYWTGEQLPGLEMIDRICAALDCDLEDVIRRRSNGKKKKKR